MKKVLILLIVTVFAVSMFFVGISCKVEAAEDAVEETAEVSAEGYPEINFSPTEIFGQGPQGEEAVNSRTLTLTAEEKAELKELGGTVVINFHGLGNFPNQMRLEAATKTFEELGVEVLASTDGQFDVATLIANIEATIALEADFMLVMPQDADALASTCRSVLDAGTQLVFMEQSPTGFKPGEDYLSVVSADNYGLGIGSAHVMAKLLGYKGKVGMVFWDADFFVTNERDRGFKETIEKYYPNMEIVAEDGFADPSDMSLITVTADGLIANNPDVDGIYASWDDPGAAVATAIKSANSDAIVVTTDLTDTSAISIASNGIIRGTDASLPWDMGVGYAMAVCYGLLGKETPEYAVPPHLPVIRDNVIEAYSIAYGVDAPQEVTDAYDSVE